ncbi:hypothetical protein [Armatimonas sp.]|uniref:hypothetical protein n=1 Tax=Armatimonas sp. TaxID=1872638 RepID=UPI00286B36A8|nr:hypothetical protein [Armatimonas sp.]
MYRRGTRRRRKAPQSGTISVHAAQYGKDSDELASTGLKKSSEYKKRGPKPASAPPTP